MQSSVRPANQVGPHRPVFRVYAEAAIQKQTKNRCWPQIPACPGQRRVAVHVLDVNLCTRLQQELNRLDFTKGRSAMQRSLAPGSAVAHESTRFDRLLQ